MANIIITGANEGIGYYMIKKLLADGNRVSVLDIETQNLEILKNKYNSNFIFYKVDLRNNEEVKMAVDKTAKEFGIIDIAVHNACKCTFKSEIETDFDTYKDVFDVNYFGALRFVKSIIPYMTAKKKGKVIFMQRIILLFILCIHPLHKQNRLLHYRCLMNLRHLQKKLVMVLRNILIQRDT